MKAAFSAALVALTVALATPLLGAPPHHHQEDAGAGLAALKSYRQFYVGPAPGEAAIREFKDRQGGIVIDLRSFKEMNCNARTAAAKIGLPYQNVPVETEGGIPPAAVTQVEAAIATAASKPVMLVCATGNRAAALLAIHFAAAEHLSVASAMRLAGALGLSSKPLATKLRRYLKLVH